MTCTCSACSCWTILVISVCFLIFTIFFYIGLVEGYDAQSWFKLIRNNCIQFYLTIVSVALMAIYSFIGLIQCCAKEKKLYLAYLTLLLLSIFLKIAIIILTMCNGDGIMKEIEKNWNSDKYRENRLLFERNFKCCGFYRYNSKEECGIEGIKGNLCGDMIKITLKEYLIQLRNISIYLISVEILPTLFASALACCSDEEKVAENNELESTTSLYNALIN